MELLVDFLLISGFVFSLIVTFLTSKSSQKKLTKKLLNYIYALAAIYILNLYLGLHVPESIFSKIVNLICFGLVLLIGPLLYFYIESIFTTKRKLSIKDKLHFLIYPTFWVLCLGSLITNEFIEEKHEKIQWVIFSESYNLFYWFETLVFIGYIIYAIFRYYTFRNILINNFSAIDEKLLAWTKKLLFGILIVMIVDVLSSTIEIFIKNKWSDEGYITIVTYILLLVYLAYYGTYKSNIFIPEQMLNSTIDIIHEKIEIQKGDRCSNEFLEFEKTFFNIVETQCPYLDPELNLHSLADCLGITDKKLSTFLNQHLNTTFYVFINKKRVEAVKKKLLTEDLKDYSIMGIAFDCGFKSKSSFNRIFKNETGQSPTQFILSHTKSAIL